MIINVIFSLLLMKSMKHNGLAFANAIASGCNFVLLFYFLRKRLGGIGTKRIVSSFGKTFAASLAMGVAGWLGVRSEIWTLSGYGLKKAVYLGSAIIICGGIYMLLSYLLKSEEMGYIIERVKEKLRRRYAD
jgi:putative peptidoglycan lipid II flippase